MKHPPFPKAVPKFPLDQLFCFQVARRLFSRSEFQVHPHSSGSSGKKTATNFWEEISEASVGHSTRVEQSLKQFQGFGGRMPSVYYSQGWKKTMKNLKRRLSLPMQVASRLCRAVALK